MDTNKSKGLDFAASENYHWAGTTYHSLGGATDTYNPRLPVLAGSHKDNKAEDDIGAHCFRMRRECMPQTIPSMVMLSQMKYQLAVTATCITTTSSYDPMAKSVSSPGGSWPRSELAGIG